MYIAEYEWVANVTFTRSADIPGLIAGFLAAAACPHRTAGEHMRCYVRGWQRKTILMAVQLHILWSHAKISTMSHRFSSLLPCSHSCFSDVRLRINMAPDLEITIVITLYTVLLFSALCFLFLIFLFFSPSFFSLLFADYVSDSWTLPRTGSRFSRCRLQQHSSQFNRAIPFQMPFCQAQRGCGSASRFLLSSSLCWGRH